MPGPRTGSGIKNSLDLDPVSTPSKASLIEEYSGNFLVKDLMTPPPPPLGVENVKIQEISEKIREPRRWGP